MINKLATRYQQRTSLFLFALAYIQLVSPIVLHAAQAAYVNRSYIARKPSRDIDPHGKTASLRLSAKSGTQIPRPTHMAKHIGGPGQPEMSSFRSVNANDMVDLFSGDFSYNIPLMDVGGYPVGIHYSSNVSMDQEASWVGLGWNINPGTISRSVRGIPDDFNGQDTMRKEQNMKANKTVGVAIGGDLELFGTPVRVGAKVGVFHTQLM